MMDAPVLTPRASQAPLPAQGHDAAAADQSSNTGVSIRLDDLVDRITYTIVDRFEVQLSNLSASETYQVIVSSDNAAGLGSAAAGRRRRRGR